ncbi:hypothetical protein HPB49_006034 [Dermacentor silvarum]|uniref:Uncharacterized protein n=1 Tax=Dermacentor silvarum TaxID=543639 RepID=A0ACB8DWW8_DERSI|nr:hypothetical protein HPB49_006034 [Dermacentor silvarum]
MNSRGSKFHRTSAMAINEQQPRPQPATPATTLLPPPRALYTTRDVWQNRKAWSQVFELFATATYLDQQPKGVQTAIFLIGIGEDARRTYSTFVLEAGRDKSDFEVLKRKFEAFYKAALNLAY